MGLYLNFFVQGTEGIHTDCLQPKHGALQGRNAKLESSLQTGASYLDIPSGPLRCAELRTWTLCSAPGSTVNHSAPGQKNEWLRAAADADRSS